MKVLIVGGGSAGWIVASTLQAALKGAVSISLVEDPNTPRIGVGEATIPTVRDMLRRFDWPEADFLRQSDASFKHAIRFDDWSGPGTSYLHPFHRQQGPGWHAAAGVWLGSDRRVPFADLVSIQGALIQGKRGPRRLDGADYDGVVPYAYHLDAEKFADELARRAIAGGVGHIQGRVADITRADTGVITAVRLEDGREQQADLYVDCSGFKALLSPKDAGWVDQSDHLLCDRAVTFRVPEDDDFTPNPFTRARALSAGWCWDIGLQSRRGRGYVYSSRHITDEAAEAELRAEEGAGSNDLPARTIRFRVGRQSDPWSGNSVAIGLSAGFIEPLESTGLYLADFAARALVEMFPPMPHMVSAPVLARQFNQLMSTLHDDLLDFILLHYAVAARRDTPFWRDASDPRRHTARLAHLLELWSLRPPSFSEFPLQFAPFKSTSYEFILLGSDWLSQFAPAGSHPVSHPPGWDEQKTRWLSELPENSKLLAALTSR